MEREFIRWLRDRVPSHPFVRVGIGDDAAQLSCRDDTIVTVDMLMEGIDFELPRTDPRRIGRKSLAVNLSDLAAMAAQPVAAFVALALPRLRGASLARELFEGILPLAAEFDIAIAGGDTNSWDGPLVISITAVGQLTARGPLLRTGARPGDEILVTGEFGGSILGRQFDFVPRVREALWLRERFDLHAGIDVSDGLSLDLARLAESSGCGAAVQLHRIPISPSAAELAASQQDGTSALDHALGDGEDFELVIAATPEEASRILADPSLPVCVTRIGRFIERPGLWQESHEGKLDPLAVRGYEHPLS